jgi:putative flippase GtrA
MKSLKERTSKVNAELLIGRLTGHQMRVGDFVEALPDILAVRGMKTLASSILKARELGAARIFMYGGHVIKCGLAPLLVKWLQEKKINYLATNGAGTIHDIEMALFGETSEDVEAGISDGSFGMWKETGEIYASALELADKQSIGLGEALGREILRLGGNVAVSPLAAACRAGIPVTVHPALGGDIVHPHPLLSWEKLGAAAERDFDLLGERIISLSNGVVINAGSAVVMPEVFLKLLTSAINLGYSISNFTAASFDMISQYRPINNVVFRPVKALGGTPIILIGHHELMLPMLDIFIDTEEAADDKNS